MPDKPREYLLRVLAVTIVLSVLFQCGYAVCQMLGIFRSGHHDYAFTGSFYNPGPLACYIAVCFPMAVRMLQRDNKFQKLAGAGMVLLCAILVPATMSRTAILACCIGGLVAMGDRLKASLTRKSARKFLWLTLIAVSVGAVGYIAKKDSADGRMLMWKVAAQAAREVPAAGVGWENVAGAYGEAQERYFASGRGSEREILVADAPQYVFNEYMQVAIAYGPGAAIVLIAVLAGGIVTALRNRAYSFAGSTAAVAVVMFASYPLQFPLFAVTIAMILAGAWLSSSSRAAGWGATAVIAGMTALFLTHSDRPDVEGGFALGRSLHQMRQYRKSTEVLLELLPHTSDPMPLNILGKNYRALGMADSAEHYLLRSTRRCPNRLYPHYLLMQLYGDSVSFNPERQRQEARYILDTREKIRSRAVEEMRTEAETVLRQYE